MLTIGVDAYTPETKPSACAIDAVSACESEHERLALKQHTHDEFTQATDGTQHYAGVSEAVAASDAFDAEVVRAA